MPVEWTCQDTRHLNLVLGMTCREDPEQQGQTPSFLVTPI